MALASQLSHKILTNTALPYQTFTSPIDQSPQYVGGRNVMINAKSFCTMRPGFADYLEPVPTTFNHVLRLFSWATWEGAYLVMAVDQLSDGRMAVYKLQHNIDQSFVQIHIEPQVSGVPYSFVTANDYLFFSNPSDCWKWGVATGLQRWGIQAPWIPTVTLTPGVLSTVNGGYQYVITYGNRTSGHESSPSSASVSTTNFTNQNPVISWTPSTDSQVDVVNIYRTPDQSAGSANPQLMGRVAQVPVGSSPYTDSTPDAFLSAVQFAPAAYQNDPPMPMASIIVYAGRVWGMVANEVWCSGQEEITNGVPQESFPGASIHSPAGNFYAYETKLTALAPLTDGIAIFTPNRIQKIEGDSQDTFRRLTLLAKRGVINDYSVKVVGNSVLWFDRSRQLWLSDQGEIGRDIRPDLSQASLLTAHSAIHIAGEQHWILLLDPDNALLYVYDLDLNGWNVPWSVSATTIESIDLSPGVTRLAAAIHGSQVMLENPGLYLDSGAQYDAFAVTNTFSLAPESNPDFLAYLDHVAIESNQWQPVSVAVRVDEDPSMLAQMSMWGRALQSGSQQFHGQSYLLSASSRAVGNVIVTMASFPSTQIEPPLLEIVSSTPFPAWQPLTTIYLAGLTAHPELNGVPLALFGGGGLTANPTYITATVQPPTVFTTYFGALPETGTVSTTPPTIPPIPPTITPPPPGSITPGNPGPYAYGGFNPLTQVNDPHLRRNGQWLLQKNYMGNPDPAAPACRRLAVRIDWRQPEPALWALYSIDLAILPVGK